MLIKDVQDYLNMIKREVRERDFERAHAAEDGMHRDVLRAIAQGRQRMTKEQMCALAAKALESDEIIFERWAA